MLTYRVREFCYSFDKKEIDRCPLNRGMICYELLPLSHHYQALIDISTVVNPLSQCMEEQHGQFYVLNEELC